MNIKLISVFLLLSVGFVFAQQWKVDLGEPVQSYHYVKDGKYLFFNSKEYAWLYDASVGNKVWDLEIKGYEKKGLHELIGEQYLVGTDNSLQSYDVMTGKLQWSKEYQKIDQDEYLGYEFTEHYALIRYDDVEVSVDLSTGEELWRAEIKYNGDLVNIGGWNFSVFNKTAKYLALEKGDWMRLYDLKTGKKALELEDIEPNEDLMKKKRSASHKSKDDKYFLLALDKGGILIDVENGKVLARKEFGIDADYDVFFPTQSGCAIFGKEMIVHFEYGTGKMLEIPYSISEMRTLESFEVDDKNILVIAGKNRLSGVDLAGGKILWETPKNDPRFEGFAHRYIKTEGRDVLISYVKAGTFTMTSGGSWVYLMRMNLLTGELTYQTLTGIAKVAIADFQRSIATAIGAFAGFLGGKAVDEGLKKTFGYDNVGFNYETREYNGNIIYVFRNRVGMANPDTKNEPGEGIVAVNPSTGAIVYKDYFELMYNDSWGPAGNGIVPFTPEPVYMDNMVYLSGNARVIGFDLNTGKRVWTVDKELKKGYPTDITVIDGVVYVKLGKDMVTPTLKENKLKVESPWEMEPHGFAAIEAISGKLLWFKELKEDPGRFLPQFTIRNYYNAETGQLYFSDEEKVYALALRRDGGAFDWELDLDKAKIGEMPVKKVYAINESWIGSVRRTTTTTYNYGGSFSYSVSTTTGGVNAEKEASFLEDAAGSELSTTYTSWGNIWGVTAKRCLRVLFDTKSLLVYGVDGIGLIDVKTGKPKWVTEWDYDYEAVQYIPRVLNGKVVYCVDRMMTSIDLKTGKQDWQVKEAKKPRFFESPDERFIFSIDDEVIKGYELK